MPFRSILPPLQFLTAYLLLHKMHLNGVDTSVSRLGVQKEGVQWND